MKRQDIRLLALARQGDLVARCEVGRRYLLGADGFPQHLPSGLEHLRQAARQDAARAARVLAECLPLHELLHAGELATLQRAAADGSATAQWRLGLVMLGLGGAEHADEGLALLRRAAASDTTAEALLDAAWAAPSGQRLHAALQCAAEVAAVDAPAVALWLAERALADGRPAAAAVALGVAAERGRSEAGTLPDAVAAGLVALVRRCRDTRQPLPALQPALLRQALEQRAAAGDRDALAWLGRGLSGLPAAGLPGAVFDGQLNVRKGAAWLLRAADAGDAEAWLLLYGLHADHSLSVANPQMARFFLEKAAQEGIAEAQRKLGALVLRGAATLADSEQAIAWLHAAAAQGDRHAKTLLKSLVLPVAGRDGDAAWALSMVQEHDVGLAARLALARAFGLTKLEALSVDPVQGLRPWGLGVWAAEICRAQVLDRLPAQRRRFVGSVASCSPGGAPRALRASLGHAVRVGFAHLAALTRPSDCPCA